ncbi:MAG TPA: sulfatase-like hydrolase/transferase [Firmicutes bacterium]|nr:sulfatase-like hydrolase/transferase [Bacillota bacterium]
MGSPRPDQHIQPNIILFHAESMDGRKMGCMNHPAMARATLHLDRLAEEGALFTNAYSTCPVCNPSRASMLSGRYPHHYGCWNNHEGLRPGVPTFLSTLAAAGYVIQTFGGLDYRYGAHSIRDRVGSWTRAAGIKRPLVRTPLPKVFPDGEDVWRGDWEKVHQAIDWLEQKRPPHRPFLLYLSTSLVHPPYKVEEQYLKMIDAGKIDIPPADDTDHPVDQYQRITKNACRRAPLDLVLTVRHVYMAMIANLDAMLGRLFAAIERMELGKSTYVIFLSDHGDMAMEHGQILKRTMYEPAIHVPLIITGPGVQKGQVIEEPVSLIDIYPTLMDMCGLKAPHELDGESLLPVVEGAARPGRGWAFAEYHGDRCLTGTFMLRKGDWKYIKYAGYRPHLFRLSDDPWEIRDLAGERADVVAELEALMSTIVDCEAVDARAKAYDKESFRLWRLKQKAEGTYEKNMALIYSGFDAVRLDDLAAWTEEDEALIRHWLGEK